ncbi:hypothetical protein EDD17DRAFT_1550285 [Pisolithus thermaeus]|nr:hypothetical protein EDD17DRAFT_1550285 [Pisolithus thermaeus]
MGKRSNMLLPVFYVTHWRYLPYSTRAPSFPWGMTLSLGTWVDRILLVVKAEGMCALSHLPDVPELASAMPAPHAVTTRPRAYPFNNGFMIRSWLTWNLDRNNSFATFLRPRHRTGIRILATVTIAAQNSLDLDSGCHSGTLGLWPFPRYFEEPQPLKHKSLGLGLLLLPSVVDQTGS